MTILKFEHLTFKPEKTDLQVIFYQHFSFPIPKTDLEAIAPFKIDKNQIEFDCPEKRAQTKFNQLIASNIKNLKNNLTKNPAVYIHQNSGIPLIGNNYFGLIYRNTSIIEIKPQTFCNLNCIYCSVGEGLESKQTDFIVEKDYLIEELQKLLQFIGQPVEAHLGVQGEPFLYQDLLPLIHDLHQMENVRVISLDTNATLLTKPVIDQLAQYQKLRLNISLNALDQKIAEKMAGTSYNLKHVLQMIEYAAPKIELLFAPLLVPGCNDQEMIKIIKLAQKLKIKIIGIQNFLNYKTGRNPVTALSWDKFKDILRNLEKQTQAKLLLDLKKDFNIKETPSLPKPFLKDQIIQAKVVSLGRFPKSCLAVAQDRNITLIDCSAKVNQIVKVKLLRDKHNIFLAKQI